MVFSWQTFNKNISSDGEKKRAAEEYLEMPWNTHVFAFSKPETNRSHTLLVAAWELCCTSMASAATDPPTIARSYSGSIPLPPWPRCALPVLNAGSFRGTKSQSSPLGFRHQTRSTTFDLLSTFDLFIDVLASAATVPTVVLEQPQLMITSLSRLGFARNAPEQFHDAPVC